MNEPLCLEELVAGVHNQGPPHHHHHSAAPVPHGPHTGLMTMRPMHEPQSGPSPDASGPSGPHAGPQSAPIKAHSVTTLAPVPRKTEEHRPRSRPDRPLTDKHQGIFILSFTLWSPGLVKF